MAAQIETKRLRLRQFRVGEAPSNADEVGVPLIQEDEKSLRTLLQDPEMVSAGFLIPISDNDRMDSLGDRLLPTYGLGIYKNASVVYGVSLAKDTSEVIGVVDIEFSHKYGYPALNYYFGTNKSERRRGIATEAVTSVLGEYWKGDHFPWGMDVTPLSLVGLQEIISDQEQESQVSDPTEGQNELDPKLPEYEEQVIAICSTENFGSLGVLGNSGFKRIDLGDMKLIDEVKFEEKTIRHELLLFRLTNAQFSSRKPSTD